MNWKLGQQQDAWHIQQPDEYETNSNTESDEEDYFEVVL